MATKKDDSTTDVLSFLKKHFNAEALQRGPADDTQQIDALFPSLVEARLKRRHEEHPTMYPNPRYLRITGGAHRNFSAGFSFRPWLMDTNVTDLQRQNFDALWTEVVDEVQDLRAQQREAQDLDIKSELLSDFTSLLGGAVDALPVTGMLRGGLDLAGTALESSRNALGSLMSSFHDSDDKLKSFIEDFVTRQAEIAPHTLRGQAAERFAGRGQR